MSTQLERLEEVIEEVLGILIEEGNGTTSEEIHYAADLLFWVRDGFIHCQRADGSWYTNYEKPRERF